MTTTTVTTPPSTSAPEGVLTAETSATEAIVRRHLRVFLEQRGIDALLADYRDDARLHTEARIYRGKSEIGAFFEGFMGALPAGGIDSFSLGSLSVERNIALISWSVGTDIPLGTDTFVVENDKIVAQTFAMCTGTRQLGFEGSET